ncbi:hypothetical protein EYF80_057077 [Liparis tanakae]|uniref:Uncharacterized protein n=1 Tax=Liparis tanakae TaxID=230148 RepID=A0A4Z2EVT3_9TELE|nr:hypothetical protein EYF80_057077 [Liparis tanakae]
MVFTAIRLPRGLTCFFSPDSVRLQTDGVMHPDFSFLNRGNQMYCPCDVVIKPGPPFAVLMSLNWATLPHNLQEPIIINNPVLLTHYATDGGSRPEREIRRMRRRADIFHRAGASPHLPLSNFHSDATRDREFLTASLKPARVIPTREAKDRN